MSPRKRLKPTPDGRAYNGGQRTSPPGTLHPNRSDMTQAPTAAKGQGYGVAGAQIAAQRAVPLPAAPPAPPPASGAAGTAGGAAGYATPSDTPTLTAPTNRPNEPLEAGMPFGPGPGPDSPNTAGMSDVEVRLRALYAAHPTRELRELIRMQDLMS